jgi:hypothetical protein
MPSYQVKQSSTAYPLVFLMIDSADHLSPKAGLSPTVTIRKVGGAFAAPAGAVTEIANGWYQVAGNATDSATLGPLILHATAAGADPVDALYEVVAVDPQDTVRFGLTSLPNAAAAANGGLPTADASNAVKVQSGTGANQISLSAGLVAIDTTRTFAVRNQDAITAPTIADALQGGWSAAFAKEAGANNSTAFAVRLPDDSGPARTFTLDAALSSGPFSRS